MARKLTTVRARLAAAGSIIASAREAPSRAKPPTYNSADGSTRCSLCQLHPDQCPCGTDHTIAYDWHTDALAKLAEAVEKLTEEVEALRETVEVETLP